MPENQNDTNSDYNIPYIRYTSMGFMEVTNLMYNAQHLFLVSVLFYNTYLIHNWIQPLFRGTFFSLFQSEALEYDQTTIVQ